MPGFDSDARAILAQLRFLGRGFDSANNMGSRCFHSASDFIASISPSLLLFGLIPGDETRDITE